jgi:hypothetical protein
MNVNNTKQPSSKSYLYKTAKFASNEKIANSDETISQQKPSKTNNNHITTETTNHQETKTESKN